MSSLIRDIDLKFINLDDLNLLNKLAHYNKYYNQICFENPIYASAIEIFNNPACINSDNILELSAKQDPNKIYLYILENYLKINFIIKTRKFNFINLENKLAIIIVESFNYYCNNNKLDSAKYIFDKLYFRKIIFNFYSPSIHHVRRYRQYVDNLANYLFLYSCQYNRPDILEYLVDILHLNINIHYLDDTAYRKAYINSHKNIIKFLINLAHKTNKKYEKKFLDTWFFDYLKDPEFKPVLELL